MATFLYIMLIVLFVVVFVAAAVTFMKQQIGQIVQGLAEKNEDTRKSHKDEIESGVKGLLDSNKDIIDRIATELRAQLSESQKEVKELRLQSSGIREQVANALKVTESLQVSTEGLKNLLTNNRLRGEWGEQVAEDLLLAAGFVENINYVKQTATSSGRPDFTILLPDGTKLNVDAKFPFDDLVAYQEAETEADKRRSLQNFRTAIKNKVKEVTSKDYIDPQAPTLDFVVMFIPNEMIFSFIYEKLPDINEYCNSKKVILAGPFGFTALVRLVLQAYKNFRYEKGLHEILGLIGKFQEEYGKFGESIQRLGKQMDIAQKTYQDVEGIRSRQLTKIVDKISEQSGHQLAAAAESKEEALQLGAKE